MPCSDSTAHIKAFDEEAKRRRQANRAAVSLEVPHDMRRYVVRHGGERLLKLAQVHPKVRVRVPPAASVDSRTVTITVHPEEVAEVMDSITAHLRAVEEQLSEQRRQNVTLTMDVDPKLRHCLMGPGGERLYKLANPHPHEGVCDATPRHRKSVCDPHRTTRKGGSC